MFLAAKGEDVVVLDLQPLNFFLFPKLDRVKLLTNIFKTLGRPSSATWPEFAKSVAHRGWENSFVGLPHDPTKLNTFLDKHGVEEDLADVLKVSWLALLKSIRSNA